MIALKGELKELKEERSEELNKELKDELWDGSILDLNEELQEELSEDLTEEPGSELQESRNEESNKKTKKKSVKKGARAYRIFLLSWILCLLLVLSFFLDKFYVFLERYEAEYTASLPETVTDELLGVFRSRDLDRITSLLTVKPEIGVYETKEDLDGYLKDYIGNGFFDVMQDLQKSEEGFQAYYLKAADRKVGYATYKKTSLPDEIPVWELTGLEMYVKPKVKVQITAPENTVLFVNGKEMTYVTRTYDGEAPSAQQFFEGLAELPSINTYVIEGFYKEPVITAKTKDGLELDVKAESEGVYVVGFPKDSPDSESMKKVAREAVSAYATFISGDLGYGEIKKYFTEDNIYLYYMTHAGLTYFTRHLSSWIQSTDILDLTVYSDEAFYCEVLVEQCLTMEWGSAEPEVITTDGKFYFVKQNGEWKVAGIEF